MKSIHQNGPKEGIFFKIYGGQTPVLYMPDRANGDFSVIFESERCVL